MLTIIRPARIFLQETSRPARHIHTLGRVMDKVYVVWFLGLFCTSALQLACKTKPTFSKLEVAELSRRVEALYASKSSPECDRPPLRSGAPGPSVALSNSKDLFALVDPQGPFAECLAFMAPEPMSPEGAAMLADYMDDGEFNNQPKPKKKPKPAVQLENLGNVLAIEEALSNYEVNGKRPYHVIPLQEVEPKVMVSLRASCAGMAKSVQEVVARNSSCSPASLAEFSTEQEISFGQELITVAKVLAVESRALARESRPLEAAQLLVDGIRLGNDLSRGRVSMLVELVAQAATDSLFAQLAHLVLEGGALDAEQGQIVYDELKTLIDTQTPASDRFAGEELALMKFNLDLAKRSPLAANIEEILLVVLGLEFLVDSRYRSCPKRSSYGTCIKGWQSFHKRIASGEQEFPFVATKSKSVRKKASDLVTGLSPRVKYLRKLSLGSARLAALELAMRSRRDGPCPAETLPGSNIDVTKFENAFAVTVIKELQNNPDSEYGYDNLLLQFECPGKEAAP